MKLFNLIGIFVILCSGLVLAGNSYDLDFSEGSTQGFYLEEGDEVRFELKGANHVVILNNVFENSIDFQVVPYADNSTQMKSGWLTLDTIANVDLEMDNDAELTLALYSISSDGIVTLVFQKVGAQNDVTGMDIGEVVDDSEEDLPGWKVTLLKLIAVLVVILVVFLIFRGKKEEVVETEVLDKVEKKPE
jgi:hypothetical protein